MENLLDDIVNTMKGDFPNTWKFNKINDEAFEVIDGSGKNGLPYIKIK
ncbi:hypothetical protein [Galbibacter sp. EGI 63066]|nr:hypothetical protein [Galbibacter sp. EGI 63066]